MSGIFDPDTEAELKKILGSLSKKLVDVLVVSKSSGEHSHEHHERDSEDEHHHHDECPTCEEAKLLASELARISEGKLVFEILYHDDEKVKFFKPRYLPAFIYDTPKRNIRYYGLPSGQEFAPFIFIHEYLSNGVKLSKKVVEELEGIDTSLHVKIFVTPECPYCPLVVDFFNQAGIVNSEIIVETIEALENPIEADMYGVQYVPYVAINDPRDYEKYGAKPVEVIPGYMQPEDNVKILKKAARKLKSGR
ncbi:MAG: thioredoxin family protein [Desulfurococcus sp.]|nr:thioredoxin family protein [Desulfurococcus sp.]